VRLIGDSNGNTDFVDFTITISPNEPPTFQAHSSTETVTAHRSKTVTYSLDTDPEGDLVLFEAELWRDGALLVPQPAWFSVNDGYLDKVEITFN